MFKFPIDPLLQQHVNLSNSLGPELTTNGTFTGSETGWTINAAAWTYNANALDKDANGTGTAAQTLTIAANKVYLVVFTLTGWSVDTVTVSLGGTSGTARGANATFREYIKTANATGALTFTPTNTSRFTLDSVSVKEVGAAPADQVTMWVEDQGGTAGKATLYIRGENGTVVGIGGDGFTFGANDEDITLAYAANTLTLAGGQLITPAGTSSLPAVAIGEADTGLYRSAAAQLDITLGTARTVTFAAGAVDFYLNNINLGASGDLRLYREAADIFQQGQDSATPAAQTFKGPDGSGTNVVGGKMSFSASNSTGNAVPAVVALTGGAATVTSGTTQQTRIDRFIPNAFKVLTNNSAVAIVNATIANGTSIGGKIVYTIEVWDGTDNQVEIGEVNYKARNKAGVVVATLAELNSAQEVDSGTLATTWDMTDANPAVITINANSSLTPSTGYPRITFAIFNLGQQAVPIQ